MLLTRAFVTAAIAVFAYAIPLPGPHQPETKHGNPSSFSDFPATWPSDIQRPGYSTSTHRNENPPKLLPGGRGINNAGGIKGHPDYPIVPQHGGQGINNAGGIKGHPDYSPGRQHGGERHRYRPETVVRPVIVTVPVHGVVTRVNLDVVFESPAVEYTGVFIPYRRMAVFSQPPTFQYSSCQLISQDLHSFVGGFDQIVATVQTTLWDVDRVTSVFGEFCSNLDLLSQRLAIYDYSSDGYPTCGEEFVNAVVQFLKQLQGFFSLIPQRYGSYQIFDGIMSQCYTALQRFFGIMQSMRLDIDRVYSQVDVNIFAQASLPIQFFRNTDTVSLLRGALQYSHN